MNNAKQYLKDADILYSFKSYGHALALTLLSDVELGKAVIYNLWSKDLISGDILPPPYQSYFRERQYGLFASDTWWVGLVIASNIEELVQILLDASEEAGEAFTKGRELSASAKRRITEVVEKMGQENGKLIELEEYRTKGFFVEFSIYEVRVSTPAAVEKNLVKERLHKAKQRIKRGEPFLSLSLTEVPRKIAKLLLEEAFQSILPLRNRISEFILPVKNQFERLPKSTVG